jgi:phosphoglycerate dehydrogenase-like enzyme
VLVDANLLIPRTVRDYVVYSAKTGGIRARWSQGILDEMSRNLIAKFGFTANDAAELELRLTEYLPRALVEVRQTDLRSADGIAMDAKDRHVVAAALSAKATVLATNNTRHFPRAWLSERGIVVLTAGQVLARLAAEHPQELRMAHKLTVANSPKPEGAILDTLETQVGSAAAAAVRAAL